MGFVSYPVVPIFKVNTKSTKFLYGWIAGYPEDGDDIVLLGCPAGSDRNDR